MTVEAKIGWDDLQAGIDKNSNWSGRGPHQQIRSLMRFPACDLASGATATFIHSMVRVSP